MVFCVNRIELIFWKIYRFDMDAIYECKPARPIYPRRTFHISVHVIGTVQAKITHRDTGHVSMVKLILGLALACSVSTSDTLWGLNPPYLSAGKFKCMTSNFVH